jgi:hypothetical protein
MPTTRSGRVLCSGIRIHVIGIVQPPGIGIPRIESREVMGVPLLWDRLSGGQGTMGSVAGFHWTR